MMIYFYGFLLWIYGSIITALFQGSDLYGCSDFAEKGSNFSSMIDEETLIGQYYLLGLRAMGFTAGSVDLNDVRMTRAY